MSKPQSDQSGFGALELVLVVLIVALIGTVGWLIYKNHHMSTSATVVTTTKAGSATPANPYAGWKTATLKYEQISFQYPSNWKLVDNAIATGSAGSCPTFTPGIDSAEITAPNKEWVDLYTGASCGAHSTPAQIASLPIKVLGQNYYISVDTANPPNQSGSSLSACISNTSSYGTIPSKNITAISGSNYEPQDVFCFTPETNGGSGVDQSASALESDPNFLTAKLIFESMKYTD